MSNTAMQRLRRITDSASDLYVNAHEMRCEEVKGSQERTESNITVYITYDETEGTQTHTLPFVVEHRVWN